MKKLRHPINSIREPFGTAGLIVACIALVVALGGTALAKGLFTKAQEKKIALIAKKYAGKPGAPGATGPAGTNGTNGKDGAAGGPGSAGKSVVTSAAAVPGECQTGTTGTKFEVEGSGTASHVCNGKNGTNGAPGQPWTLGGTLPGSGEPGCPCSEKGAWGVAGPPVFFEVGEVVLGSISFPIPLEEAPEPHVMLVGEPPATGCSGSPAEPEAAPDNLCIFVATEEHVSEVLPVDPGSSELGSGLFKAGPTGAILAVSPTAAATTANAYGTWAVTAP